MECALQEGAWEFTALVRPSLSQEESLAIERELRQSVMDYLGQNPQAMDTLDGIAEWWVQGQTHVDIGILERVLRRLTDEGFLQEIRSGSAIRFSLRKSQDGNA